MFFARQCVGAVGMGAARPLQNIEEEVHGLGGIVLTKQKKAGGLGGGAAVFVEYARR